MIAQINQDLSNPDTEYYISGEGNWRYAIYPEYKLNRKNKPMPVHLQAVREHLVLKYKAKVVNDREVDDMCGIRMTEEYNETTHRTICVSLDKDLEQIPGWHYNILSQASKLISPLQGIRKFYGQVITGDAADHIPAFDGKFRSSVPKFVQALLDPLEDMEAEEYMYEHAHSLYAAGSLAVRNAKVLWVQRSVDDMWKVPL